MWNSGLVCTLKLWGNWVSNRNPSISLNSYINCFAIKLTVGENRHFNANKKERNFPISRFRTGQIELEKYCVDVGNICCDISEFYMWFLARRVDLWSPYILTNICRLKSISSLTYSGRQHTKSLVLYAEDLCNLRFLFTFFYVLT